MHPETCPMHQALRLCSEHLWAVGSRITRFELIQEMSEKIEQNRQACRPQKSSIHDCLTVSYKVLSTTTPNFGEALVHCAVKVVQNMFLVAGQSHQKSLFNSVWSKNVPCWQDTPAHVWGMSAKLEVDVSASKRRWLTKESWWSWWTTQPSRLGPKNVCIDWPWHLHGSCLKKYRDQI